MEDILIGTTDRTILVFMPDPASTTGAGKTGLNAAAVTITYTRVETDNDVVHTDVTSSVNDLSALTDAHNDWGWKEVSSTLSKGLYRLDVADAVFASGAWEAVVQVTITSGTAAATPKAFRLIARNDLTDISQTGDAYAIVNSGTHGNAALKTLIDAIDNFVDTEVQAIFDRLGAPAGESVSADVAAVKAETAAIVADTNELQTDWANGGRLDLILDIIAADTTTDIPALISTVAGYLDTEIAAILADTNELQTDWANGGRLDLILDARASQTSVDDLPTNAELSTALGTADDAVLAAIAALSIPTAVQNADALLGRNVAGGSSTGRTVSEAFYFLRNKWIISGGTLTVYQTDDATSSWTASITQTAGNPVSASDPA